jgi:UDP-N-acetyl-L-fucosamine synthase
MTQPTIVTVVGTRPEIIRLSRVISRLDSVAHQLLVHTGQNYDRQLNEVFFEEMGIRAPDRYLKVDTSSLGAMLGDTLRKVEEVLVEAKPDALLVLGDTNSAISALIAKRMNIPVYHMEAGNRSFDENVPEETNRRLVDHIADFNLPYTENARRNLLAEGLQARRIAVTGSPMREVLDFYRDAISASDVLDRLAVEKHRYFLVSAHRQENVDFPVRLRSLIESLGAIHENWGFPVLVSTHPRTRKQLETLMGDSSVAGITFHEPFGFFDYCKLQLNSACVLSDSGTISEEASILGFPAITIRDSMERPEALDVGAIVMTGLERRDVLEGVTEALAERAIPASLPAGYEVTDTSRRVVRFMMSTLGRHHEWAGIRR